MQILRKTELKGWKKAKQLGPESVISLVKKKGLTGRGGAGFPAGQKWAAVASQPEKERYVICNADEGEPGTFKDRLIIEKNPETLVEGIIICAYAVRAKKAYIYLRAEYTCLMKSLQKAVSKVLKESKADLDIEIFLGAGAYVCGSETGIISSIEGLRGQPRLKIPYPTTEGLFGKPTVVNNVETLANVPHLLVFEDWTDKLRLHCISGDVNKPGVYELPMGTKLSEIMEMAEPKLRPKAVYFGCFGGCMPYKGNEDMALNPENVCGENCMLGSCTLIVADESKSILEISTNIAKFYEFESCGKCTPCREGTMRILAILERISLGKGRQEDLQTLQDLGEVMRDTSFCGLGQTASHHILNGLKFFREEFEARIKK